MNNTSACLITGALLSFLLFAGEGQAWVPGGTGGNVDMGGTITPSGPKNPWEVQVGDAVTGLDMVLPESGTVMHHRLKQTLPVLGIRTTTGLAETFGGETAGGIAPQITFSGTLPGPRERGRLPLELDVTRASDSSHFLGVLRLSLLTGAEVSQKNPATNDGRRYSVWAGQAGEAFYGGIARTPEEAVDDALTQVGDVFPVYRARYNDQGLPPSAGAKQSVEFRNAGIRYSGFYGAGLVQGDIITLRSDSGLPSTAEAWRAGLKVAVEYR
ncbi:hypothetical protein ABRC84_003719 [Salmonella enterica]